MMTSKDHAKNGGQSKESSHNKDAAESHHSSNPAEQAGHAISHAFRTWFRDTEADGTPLLPHQLSKKYNVTSTVLGQGSFAVVKLAVEKKTGEERALKIVAKKPLKDSNEKMLKEEIHILAKVEHPNILKMYDLWESKEGVFIVTDLCRGGELFDRLVEKVHYNELDARHIMKQILSGVEYLHKMGIIHRDLKPENILLKDKTDPSDIIISDFGLSRFMPSDSMLMTACGSPQYVSPEVLLGKGYGPAVDVWSSGVIAYCLLAGYTPFYGEDQPSLFRQIVEMKVEFEPQYWDDISSLAKDFICKCLCRSDKRMTASEALQHPWLKDLPELHDKDAERGACLKECAKRHAKAKLGRAVTTIEVVDYLSKLHSLRHLHSERELIPSDSLSSLQGIVDNINDHSSQYPLEADEDGDEDAKQKLVAAAKKAQNGMQKDDSHATLTADMSEENDDQTPPAHNKMDVDLCVMSAFMPDGWNEKLREVAASVTSTTPVGAQQNQSAPNTPHHRAGTAALAEATSSETPAAGMGKDGETGSPTGSSPGQSSITIKPQDSALSSSQNGHVPNASANASRSTSATRGQAPHSSSSSTTSKPRPKQPSKETKDALNTLLEPYKGTTLPSSARLDPTVPTRQPTKITFSNAWRYLPFLVHQGVSIGTALASHAIYGPPKKSWGIEMSVFTKMLRDCAQYSEFATIAGLQQFFDLGSFLPVPSDGLITPVTFRVKKRGLKGFLAEADAQEDGKRELTGEWVVGKQTWKRLQAEWRNKQEKGRERVILYFHGGAYFIMSAATHRPLTIALSKYTDCRVFGINYRLAPDTKFPGALHDCVSSYFRLVDELGIPPNNIVLGADSAGGGLALATLLYLRDNGYPLPSGAMLFSPWVDLTMSCDSWDTNATFDYLPRPQPGDHMNPVTAYLGEGIEKYLTHPYASPLFGDMKGLPPLLIQCGDAEVLRDEGTLLAHKASMAGVSVRHELYEDCVHVFQAFLFLDASRKALQSARHFVRTALDRGRTRSRVSDKARQEIDREMRKNMGNSQGQRVEPRTGEAEGSIKSQSDGEERDSDRDEEHWELDQKVSEDTREGSAQGASAGSAMHDAFKAAGEALGVDSNTVTKATDEGVEEARAATSRHRRSSTQPSSPVAQRQFPTSNGDFEPSRHQHTSSTSSSHRRPTPSMSLDEARASAQAGMRAQQHGHSHVAGPTGKFLEGKTPSAPRLRERSRSHMAIDQLVKSFESKPAMKTARWTPDTWGA